MGGSPFKFLLLFGIVFLLGAVANPNKAPFHQVTGMAGKPVLFPLNITSGETVLMIKWDLYPRNGTPFELAVLRNGQLRTSNLKDRDRLDVLNETTLRIKALQENETGVLNCRVTYTTSKMEIFSFNLTVSVPAPENDPPDVPNVSHSEGENLNIFWRIFGSIFGILVVLVVGLICWKRKTLASILQKVFRCRNSTSNATELREVVTSPSASQNGYAKCPPSEPDETSDSTPQTT